MSAHMPEQRCSYCGGFYPSPIGHHHDNAECVANARLRDAAPDLLEAGLMAAQLIADIGNASASLGGNKLVPVYNALRAAIAKARGES